MTTSWRCHPTPLGSMILAATPDGLIGAWFSGQAHCPGVAADWHEDLANPLLRAAGQQLDEWFSGRRQQFALPLAAQGTAFQRAVWDEIARVGYGQTRTYAEVAARLGKPGAARAAGAATAHNPLAIIVPCHRLLGSHGALVGYAGGLERKRALLALEAAHAPA